MSNLLPALLCYHYYCTHIGTLETSKQQNSVHTPCCTSLSVSSLVQQRVESAHWPYIMQARAARRGTSGGRLRYISEHTKYNQGLSCGRPPASLKGSTTTSVSLAMNTSIVLQRQHNNKRGLRKYLVTIDRVEATIIKHVLYVLYY